MSQYAEDRARALYLALRSEVPPIALAYVRWLSPRIVETGHKVYAIAYAHYAQVVEGLPCKDVQYVVTDEGREFLEQEMKRRQLDRNKKPNSLFNADEVQRVLQHIGQSVSGNHGRTFAITYTLYGSPRSAHIKGNTVSHAITNFSNAVPYDTILDIIECEAEPRAGYLHWLELLTDGHVPASNGHYELQVGRKMLLMRYSELAYTRLRAVNLQMNIKELEADLTERAEELYGAKSVEEAKDRAHTQEKTSMDDKQEEERAQTLADIQKIALGEISPAIEHLRDSLYRSLRHPFNDGGMAVIGTRDGTLPRNDSEFILTSDGIKEVLKQHVNSEPSKDDQATAKDEIPEWLQEPEGGNGGSDEPS